MVPWAKLGRALVGNFFVNWVKTLMGAALVGWGLAIIHDPSSSSTTTTTSSDDRRHGGRDDDEENDDDERDGKGKSSQNARPPQSDRRGNNNNNNNANNYIMSHTERYISGSVLVGFGMFLTLPSLTSQTVWETAIPGVRAAEIVGTDATSDLFTIGLADYFKSLRSTVGEWRPIGGGGGSSGGGKAVARGAADVARGAADAMTSRTGGGGGGSSSTKFLPPATGEAHFRSKD